MESYFSGNAVISGNVNVSTCIIVSVYFGWYFHGTYMFAEIKFAVLASKIQNVLNINFMNIPLTKFKFIIKRCLPLESVTFVLHKNA